MKLEAKEVRIEKASCCFRAFFFQRDILLIQEQIVALLFEKTIEKEHNAFSDRSGGKGEDDLSAHSGDIERGFSFCPEGMDCEPQVAERFMRSLKNSKQGGEEHLGILLTRVHNDEQIRQEGMTLFSPNQRGEGGKLGKKEASVKDLRKGRVGQQVAQTGSVLLQRLT